MSTSTSHDRSDDGFVDRADDRDRASGLGKGPRVIRSDDPIVLDAADVHVVDVRVGPGRGDGSVQRVTGVRGSHTEDVARRMRTYAISMGIRTLCVLGAILAFPNWWAWLFVPGAVVLPYVAVVLANAGRERAPGAPAHVALTPSNLPVLRTAVPPRAPRA